MEHTMRRKDRAMPQEDTLRLLEAGEYGTLATAGADGGPSAVPLSYVWMDGAVYFHSAMVGQKVDNMRQEERVCFCVVGSARAAYAGDFTTLYESAVVYGRALPVAPRAEKEKALLALCQKYLPGAMAHAPQSLERSIDKTAVYKITPDTITGKANRGRR